MKRIVLSPEDKQKYEQRAHELQLRALGMKFKRRPKHTFECAHCKRNISIGQAQKKNGLAYCGKRCLAGDPKKKNSARSSERKKIHSRRREQREYRARSDEFFHSREWRELRYEALIRYGRKCGCCGATPPNVVLHVDHVKPRLTHPELALDINNLQILCAACNVGKGALIS